MWSSTKIQNVLVYSTARVHPVICSSLIPPSLIKKHLRVKKKRERGRRENENRQHIGVEHQTGRSDFLYWPCMLVGNRGDATISAHSQWRRGPRHQSRLGHHDG